MIAVIEVGINIDLSLLEIFGKYEFIVINSVWRELKNFKKVIINLFFWKYWKKDQ